MRGEGLLFLASAYPENRYLDWGGPRVRSVVERSGQFAAEGQKDQLRKVWCGVPAAACLGDATESVRGLSAGQEAGGSRADAVGNGWFCLFVLVPKRCLTFATPWT